MRYCVIFKLFLTIFRPYIFHIVDVSFLVKFHTHESLGRIIMKCAFSHLETHCIITETPINKLIMIVISQH